MERRKDHSNDETGGSSTSVFCLKAFACHGSNEILEHIIQYLYQQSIFTLSI